MSESKSISTTLLAKKYSLTAKELFKQLEQLALIKNEDKKWILTDKGIATGGSYKESKQYGHYIVWPQDLHLNQDTDKAESLINATKIGEHFNLSARRINFILSELGWIKKELKGWTVTKQGQKQGVYNMRTLKQVYLLQNGQA